MHLAALHLLLADFTEASGCKCLFKGVVLIEFAVRYFALSTIETAVDMDNLALLLNTVILSYIDNVRRKPVEHALMNLLWPRGWVVIVLFTIGIARHGGQHKALLGISLVLALGVQVEEH